MAKLNANSIEFGSLTSAQRDALTGVSNGTVIYNSSINILEVYTPGGWEAVGEQFAPFQATGGTTSTTSRSGYTVHTFTSPGTFTVTSGSKEVEYTLYGGGSGANGGRGGVNYGPGGAAGVLRSGSRTVSTPQSVTVGAGGAGASPTESPGNAGSTSYFGPTSASGGGPSPNAYPGANNADYSGNPGGFSGGGGAGSGGNSGGTAGGPGSSNSIRGSSETRGYGGSSGNDGASGSNGTSSATSKNTAAAANTGSGGGGSPNGGPTGNGGSGIVIIAYPNA
jgi:hypothetical protein